MRTHGPRALAGTRQRRDRLILGTVLLSLGVLLGDFLIVVVALLVVIAGITLEVVLGNATIHILKTLF